MIFELKAANDPKLQEMFESEKKRVEDFFGFSWNELPPNLILLPNRASIDSLYGERTEPWVRGFFRDRNVYFLKKESYKKECSQAYSEEEFRRGIRHDLAHVFTTVLSENNSIPIWLLEGIACYVAEDIAHMRRPEKFSTFLKHFSKFDPEVYEESGFAVQFLVEKYGKRKLLRLLKSLRGIGSKSEFRNVFKEVYGFLPDYKNFEVPR
jgi:hypothetical protein